MGSEHFKLSLMVRIWWFSTQLWQPVLSWITQEPAATQGTKHSSPFQPQHIPTTGSITSLDKGPGTQGLIQTQPDPLSPSPAWLCTPSPNSLQEPAQARQCQTLLRWLGKQPQNKVRQQNITSEREGGFCSTLSWNVNSSDTRDSRSLQLDYKLSSIPRA